MKLEELFKNSGIDLRAEDGSLRNAIDILEDMYSKLSGYDFVKLMNEIAEEEKYADLFKDAKKRGK